MNSIRFCSMASTAIALSLCASIPAKRAFAQQPPTTQTAPDNSHQNKNQAPTADNQTNAKSDRLTAASIRKAIIADKDLSTYAHNVKIISLNGAVTLKGPVRSDEEKQKVAADAASVISSDKITNELTVKP